MIEEVRLILITPDLAQCIYDELRNHILFCQQVEAYLLLKFAISRGDIELLPHALTKAVVLFHGSNKHNYQFETLYMFWLTCTNAISSELKRALLANSLVNISGLENKFIPVDLHLELHNEYMKKILRDRRTSSLDLECLFEYSARFASTVRQQLIWMKRFHDVRVNAKHAVVKQEDDLIKLTHELYKEMKYNPNRQVPSIDQARDLFVCGAQALAGSIQKFNHKFRNNVSVNVSAEEEILDCELMDLFRDEELDNWVENDELNQGVNARRRLTRLIETRFLLSAFRNRTDK
jgi:hypothetical protein